MRPEVEDGIRRAGLQDAITVTGWVSSQQVTGANIDLVANGPRPFVLDVTQTNHDSIADTAIVAKLCVAANDDATDDRLRSCGLILPRRAVRAIGYCKRRDPHRYSLNILAPRLAHHT
jgi:hypothetical protein